MIARTIELLKTRWGLLLLGVAIVLHLLMMGSLFWGYLNPFFFVSDLHRQGIDFFSIYEAGHRAIENQSVYDNFATDSSVTPYFLPYRYVPFFAYAFAVPVNAVPPWWAYWGWVAFNELLLIVNAYATWRIAGRGKWGAIAAAMWFVFTPFYIELYVGQFSFLMATALFWTGISIIRGRETLAGFPWIVSLLVKSNSALLAPLFLRLGWWRPMIAGAVLVGLNFVYFIWHPHDIDVFYTLNFSNVLSGAGERYILFSPGDHGALALLRNSVMALDSTVTNVPPVYSVGLAVVVVGYSLEATFFARKTDPLALFAIWVSAFFLFYSVWEFHYVMFLPVLVLLVALRPSARPWALPVFVFVALPTPYWLLNHVWNTGPLPQGLALLNLQDVWPAWGVILYHAMKPVPVIVLWTYLAVSLFRQGIVDLRWSSLFGASSQRVD